MKTLVALSFVLFFIAVILTPSCKNAESTAETTDSCCAPVNADSLIALWNNAWNTDDSIALSNMIADDAVVIEHDWSIKGKDSLFAQWITPSLTKIRNLTTNPLQINSCCCCVNVSGFYSLDYVSKNGTVPSRGNFSFTWIQQEDNTYKLVLMLMTEFHDKATK